MPNEKNFQDFLDAISRCFIAHDFPGWKDRVVLPFSLITSAGPVHLIDEAQLRENFELYLIACDAMHLDEIVRKPVSLEKCDDGTWIGTYETELLSHGHRATAPYTSSALLRDDAGFFRMTSIMNARGHHHWTGKWPGASGQGTNLR